MTIGKYDGYRLYLISCMDRYSVYSTYTLIPEKNMTFVSIFAFLFVCMNFQTSMKLIGVYGKPPVSG